MNLVSFHLTDLEDRPAVILETRIELSGVDSVSDVEISSLGVFLAPSDLERDEQTLRDAGLAAGTYAYAWAISSTEGAGVGCFTRPLVSMPDVESGFVSAPAAPAAQPTVQTVYGASVPDPMIGAPADAPVMPQSPTDPVTDPVTVDAPATPQTPTADAPGSTAPLPVEPAAPTGIGPDSTITETAASDSESFTIDGSVSPVDASPSGQPDAASS